MHGNVLLLTLFRGDSNSFPACYVEDFEEKKTSLSLYECHLHHPFVKSLRFSALKSDVIVL